MKSRFFKNLAKGLVIMSAALAVVNCDESTVSAAAADAQQQYGADPSLLSSSGMADPALGGGAVVDPTLVSSSSTDIIGGGEVVEPGVDVNPASSADVFNPASSADVNPVSSANVNPASSETVAPASSSSEKAPVVSSSSEEAKPQGIFLAEGTDENKDQMEISYTENIEPCMFKDGKNLCKILAYPKRLSTTQKHGVVMWGPGGGSDPKSYSGIIKRLASHGFVVVAIPESPGDASQGKSALDWLESKNNDPNDPLYQKLDMSKVGCSGHSMGGLESEQMVIKDSRVITAMLNNSGDLGHTAMSQVSPSKTIGIVYGEGGMERPNAEADYNNAGVRAPACLLKMTGGKPSNECQQGECGWGHGSGPWGGMAATVAWMRWHLGGEDFRKADFVGSTGKYIDGAIIGEQGKWKGQCKNF